jgi:hypothetical protein
MLAAAARTRGSAGKAPHVAARSATANSPAGSSPAAARSARRCIPMVAAIVTPHNAPAPKQTTTVTTQDGLGGVIPRTTNPNPRAKITPLNTPTTHRGAVSKYVRTCLPPSARLADQDALCLWLLRARCSRAPTHFGGLPAGRHAADQPSADLSGSADLFGERQLVVRRSSMRRRARIETAVIARQIRPRMSCRLPPSTMASTVMSTDTTAITAKSTRLVIVLGMGSTIIYRAVNGKIQTADG